MERHSIQPRDGWQKKVSELGLVYHQLPNGKSYWNEGAYYSFSAAEVDALELSTNLLQQMYLAAGQYIIDNNRFADLGIPEAAVPLIKWSWDKEPPAIYGRFDLAYDGTGPAKLLEYNADTPTALLEASVIQWYWLKDQFPHSDQFNSIHERLVDKWRELKDYLSGTLYVAHVHDEALEDVMTATYMRDTAQEAGLATAGILMKDLGWNEHTQQFVDYQKKPIHSLFKLYPWEWIVHESFGRHALDTYSVSRDNPQGVQWIEPIWKMMFSNKGTLAILWEMYPKHENLLEAHLKDPHGMQNYVRKPLLSREGANIQVMQNYGLVLETAGDYGAEGYVYQDFRSIKQFDGMRPVLGSWVIDQVSAGIGIRETAGLVTDNMSSFVPHLFE